MVLKELNIRPSVIWKLFWTDNFFLIFLVMLFFIGAIALSILPYLIVPHFPTLLDKISRYPLGAWFLVILFISLHYTLSKNWFRFRKELTQGEHYLVLLSIAMLTAVYFGLFNYTCQYFDALVVKQELLDKDYEERKAEIEEEITASELLITDLNHLMKEIDSLEEEFILQDKPWYIFWSGDRVFASLKTNNLMVLEYSPKTEPTDLDGFYTLSVHCFQREYDINTFRHAKANPQLYEIEKKDTLTKSDLLPRLSARVNWEVLYFLNQRKAELRSIKKNIVLSPMLFIYEAVMDVLSASPSYTEPKNALTKLMSLIFNLLKFVYFGLFISLVSSNLSLNKTSTS